MHLISLLKGTKNEIILSSKIIEVLIAIDPTFKKHANMAINESQKILNDVFGFGICNAQDLVYDQDKNVHTLKGKYFIYNNIKNMFIKINFKILYL